MVFDEYIPKINHPTYIKHLPLSRELSHSKGEKNIRFLW